MDKTERLERARLDVEVPSLVGPDADTAALRLWGAERGLPASITDAELMKLKAMVEGTHIADEGDIARAPTGVRTATDDDKLRAEALRLLERIGNHLGDTRMRSDYSAALHVVTMDAS